MKLKSATALVASSLTLFAASLAIAQSHTPPPPVPIRRPVTAVPVGSHGNGPTGTGGATTGPTVARPVTATGTGTGTSGTGANLGGPPHGPPATLGQAGGGASVHEFEAGIDYTPLPPGARITFNLQDADLPDLIRAIGNITGKRFILPGKVRSIKTTIYSPTKVTPGEAYMAFLSTLEANGLTVVPSGRYLKITETGGIATDSLPTYAPGEGSPVNDSYVTRIHRLHNMSADDAAAVLGHFKSHDGDITPYAATNTLVVTDTGSNIRRMLQILSEIDVPAVGEQIWIERLHYASAQDLSQRITDILGGGSGGGGGGGGGGRSGGGGGAAGTPGSSDTRLTRIMPDERSNSLIIVATERMYLRVLELVRRLDVPIQNGEGDIQVYYLQHADAEELSNTLNQITGGGSHGAAGQPAAPSSGGGAGQHALSVFEGPVRVSPDKRTNSLIITSSPRDFAGIRRVINELDHARRQVFIEAVVMELSVNNTNKLGVSWHGPIPDPTSSSGFGLFGFGALNSVGFPTSLASNQDALQGLALGIRGAPIPGTQNLIPGLTLGVPAFGAVIDALAQSGDSDVLATPSIIALDNEPADINVGQDIPLQTNVGGIPSLGGAAGATGLGALGGLGLGLGGFSAPRTKVGTKIHIVPHINESNEIRMDIEEEVSEAGDPVGALGAVPINLRTAKTKMVVQDQQTVVIGGLVRNSIRRGTTRIPILGDLPLIGFLFRNEQRTVERRNLLLFLTPYVIRDQSDLRRIFERKMRERQEFLDRYFVFSESQEYHPHIDYSRTNGLVEEIREAIRDLREQAEIEARAMPPPAPPHTVSEPIELPAEVRPAGENANETGPPGGGGGGESNNTAGQSSAPAPTSVVPIERRGPRSNLLGPRVSTPPPPPTTGE